MRNYTFGTLLAVFSLHCNNIGFVDKAKAVVNNEFGVVVFYTNAAGAGDFLLTAASFSGVCGSLVGSGIARANCICASEASSQSYAGTYRAWLSTSTVDAICNIQGEENNSCNPRSDLGPFVAKNGSVYSVVAADLTELSSSGFRTSIGSDSVRLWSGSSVNGRSNGLNCGNYTFNDGTIMSSGQKNATGAGFTTGFSGVCSDTAALICMKQTK